MIRLAELVGRKTSWPAPTAAQQAASIRKCPGEAAPCATFTKPHATKLYRQIIEEYPDSPYAESGFLDWIESIDVALTMPIKKGA